MRERRDVGVDHLSSFEHKGKSNLCPEGKRRRSNVSRLLTVEDAHYCGTMFVHKVGY